MTCRSNIGRMRLRLAFLLLVMTLLAPGIPAAQVVNGDFEEPEEVGWTDDLPSGGWTATFPDTGGLSGGCARIASPTPDGDDYGCLSQTFSCGVPGGPDVCLISVSYRHQNLGAETRTGGVEIRLDGEPVVVTGRDENGAGWRTATVTAACGTHTLALCLVRVKGAEIDGAPGKIEPAGDIEGWEAVFDDVSATCQPASAVQPGTWSGVKRFGRDR